MTLNQKLIITHSNQKARDIKENFSSSLDKVITLDNFVQEFFEKSSFKKELDSYTAKALIFKIIKDENINYFDFIKEGSGVLDLIYDFILKLNGSKAKIEELLEDEKLEAIKLINSKYSEFKIKNNFVDTNDIYIFAIKNLNNYDFSIFREVLIDSFVIENIKLYKSNLQLDLLNLLNYKFKELTPFKNAKNDTNLATAKLFRLSKEPFNIDDEVQSALKLARKLLEDNESLSSKDICIITTDINSYAPIFRLYLSKYELKGFDSKGVSLKLFKNKKSSNLQVINSFKDIKDEIKRASKYSKEFDLNINLEILEDRLIDEKYILQDKIGIELTEANQLLGLNKKYKHIIFIGTDINHFPPKRADNFLFNSTVAQDYFCENSYYDNSLLQYNELKKIAKNLYILQSQYQEKRELAPSIIIDKNIENFIDISNIKAKRFKIEKEDYLNSLKSENYTKYDGLDVENIKVNHLSASQLSSYAKCPLRYLYLNRLRINAPRTLEDGFDVAQKGTLMHSCFENFSKKIKSNTTYSLNDFMKVMKESLEEEYEIYINDENNEIEEENIYHKLFKSELQKGLSQDDSINSENSNNDGLLAKFVKYYDAHKEELNYLSNSEFEKEFALDCEFNPYEIQNDEDKNYFIKGFIDRYDNLENKINIIDYKSKKADGVLQDKLDEIKEFKDFQLGLYTLFARRLNDNQKDIDSSLLTFKTKNNFTQFARVTTNEELIPQNKKKDTGVLYDDIFEENLISNIKNIQEKIEEGNFIFDSSDEKHCEYCEIAFMCNKGLVNKVNNR